MLKQLASTLIGLALLGTASAASLDVVATSPSMGALVRAVAADRVGLTTLAGPDQDLHQLQAKPSMIRALRGAELVVAIGAELEVGWLPLAITSAANPGIQPGRDGYFEAAAQVELLEVGGSANRALGDVHPLGNPHVNMDPERMAGIARALAGRLARIDPAGADLYARGAADFAERVGQRLPGWRQGVAGAPGVVLYHDDALYLLERLGIPLLGTIEAIPGIPPSGRHLSELTAKLKGRKGIVIYAPYQAPQAATTLAQDLGWRSERLSLEPPAGSDGEGYLRHIDHWVDALAARP